VLVSFCDVKRLIAVGCPSSDHDPEVDWLKLADGLEKAV
jgi:hypothetical protein